MVMRCFFLEVGAKHGREVAGEHCDGSECTTDEMPKSGWGS